MLKQGANSVQIYDNVTGKFWDIEGESEILYERVILWFQSRRKET
jgi:hypothetical protein